MDSPEDRIEEQEWPCIRATEMLLREHAELNPEVIADLIQVITGSEYAPWYAWLVLKLAVQERWNEELSPCDLHALRLSAGEAHRSAKPPWMAYLDRPPSD